MRTFLAVAILISQFAYNAQAQESRRPCYPLETIQEVLGEKFGQAPAYIGNAGEVAVVIFVNPETGTFTLLSAQPDGTACFAAKGDRWRALKPVDEGNPS